MVSVVLEGGTMRAIFSSGVLDGFLDNNIEVTATPCLECESCKERESMASLILTDVNKYSVTYKVEA